MLARRVHVPIQTRFESRNALKHSSMYLRITRHTNHRRQARRAGKVDQVTRGVCPPAATHLAFTSDEPLLHLEPTL